MRGYKSVDELSLKDCYEFLMAEENKDNPMYPAIAEWYDEMLQELVKQDDSDYAACKTIANYEAYIKRFSDSNVAPYYRAKHINEAKNTIEDLFWNSHKKRVSGCKEYLNRYPEGKYANTAYDRIGSLKKTRWLILGIVLLVIVIAFFIGYKPVNSLSVSESSLSFGKWGGRESVRVSTNVSSNAVDVHCSGLGFSVHNDPNRVLECSDFIVSAEPNEGDTRTGKVRVTAYATLYGMRIGSGESASTNLSQESGLATRLAVSIQSVNTNKWGGEYPFTIQTDGVALDISPQDKWFSIEKKQKGEYVLVIPQNPSDRREEKIMITSGVFRETITVTQASGLASKISIDREEINWVAQEGTAPGKVFIVGVQTDGTSYSVSYPDWTDVTIYDDHFKIKVEAADNVRDGAIVVRSNNGQSQTLHIYQDGNPTSFAADESSWTFDTGSDYDDIYINNNSHKSVSVSTSKTWLSARMNGKSVRISCDRNDDEPRDGMVTLRCGNKETNIRVHQKGWRDCNSCNGNGYKNCYNYNINNNLMLYVRYEGNRHVYVCDTYWNGWQWVPQWCDCPKCKGIGRFECDQCDGKGRYKVY